MTLEAVWFRNGEEVGWIDPVVNIVCDEDMRSIEDIEVNDGRYWHSSGEIEGGADDFIIRIKKD